MQPFVKAIEIWVPGSRGMRLEPGTAYYGGLEAFRSVSESMGFDFDQGLPGKAWAEGKPIVLTDLTNSYFQRGAAASQAGIACGVSIPVFCGEFLQAVVILFCGDGSDAVGAMEVWNNPGGSNSELRLLDGYYGELERFEWVSRRLTIMRGRGLPGMAWALGKPVVIDDLGNSNAFLRARNAAEAGITTGLAIPFKHPESGVHILTLLSAQGSPIARRFEIWVRDEEQQVMRFESGHCASGTDLAARYADTVVRKGRGPLGEAWLTGRPLVAGDGHDASDVLVVLPVFDGCALNSMVCLVL